MQWKTFHPQAALLWHEVTQSTHEDNELTCDDNKDLTQRDIPIEAKWFSSIKVLQGGAKLSGVKVPHIDCPWLSLCVRRHHFFNVKISRAIFPNNSWLNQSLLGVADWEWCHAGKIKTWSNTTFINNY